MKTFFLEFMPSISVKIWLRTRSPAPPASPPPPPRALAIESNSSKNITQGAAARALSNTSRTLASDSPNHIVRSSGPWDRRSMTTHKIQVKNAHLNTDEVRIAFVGDSLGKQRLTRTRRTIEQYTLRR